VERLELFSAKKDTALLRCALVGGRRVAKGAARGVIVVS